MYRNHVQLIGCLAKDPERRQVRGSGSNFTVLPVATQQSWKAAKDEWQAKTEWHRWEVRAKLAREIVSLLRCSIEFGLQRTRDFLHDFRTPSR